MKKIIVFDLDETLTETRSLITDELSELLGKLLENYQMCVISGGNFGQFQKQLLNNFDVKSELLTKLHLMPTCGTRYYRYDLGKKDWQQVYAENLAEDEKEEIIQALDKAAEQAGLKIDNPKGPLIEDRESQVTYSALGQDAQPAEKKAWDPDGAKKKKIRDIAAELLPKFEVRMGGTTSIDVTKPGIDKAYGMNKLMENTGVTKEELLFIGDRVFEGGNDYPVYKMGVDCVPVGGFDHTPWVVRGILAVK